MTKAGELHDLTGQQVGRYTVVRHLASGGMAELYIARQEAMGGFEKEVVLKVLQPRFARNPRVVTMFLDEARLAARLNHPAIVHVYDVAEEGSGRGGGMKYIAMEYIHGETLADIVKRGLAVDNYLPLEHAIHIVRQTAAGLGYAHERREPDGRVLRIVHRDVSPTNILVSYEGQTKLVDFGIARAQDELREESGILPGKASYMSPEQVRGAGVDPRSDIFALGIILYELTLCQRLYRGSPEVVMRRILEETVTPPTAVRRDYPAELELIVMRALEKRPDDRYQSAESMLKDLEEYLEESGLRTSNRRMALYMQELFAPETPASDAGIAPARGFTDPRPGLDGDPESLSGPGEVGRDRSEELDFDRRAPLAMRIEVAPDQDRRARPRSPGAAQPLSASASTARAGATGGRPADPITPTVARRAVSGERPSLEARERTRSSTWIVVATLVAIAVLAMVFATLK